MVDDIGLFGLPYDQTSNVSANTSKELNRDTNPIRAYFVAVSNQALSHYEEPFVVDSVCLEDGSTCHQFDATANTTDALTIGPNGCNFVLVPDKVTVLVVLT